MSLYHRLLRRLGKDTTLEVTDTETEYAYTFHFLDGSTSRVCGHGYKTSEGFVQPYVCNDFYLTHGLSTHDAYFWPNKIGKREFGGVKEITKTRIGDTKYRAVVDLADGSVVEKELKSDNLAL